MIDLLNNNDVRAPSSFSNVMHAICLSLFSSFLNSSSFILPANSKNFLTVAITEGQMDKQLISRTNIDDV